MAVAYTTYMEVIKFGKGQINIMLLVFTFPRRVWLRTTLWWLVDRQHPASLMVEQGFYSSFHSESPTSTGQRANASAFA